MVVTYDPADPRFPDISHYRPVTDVAAFKAAKPVALGFKGTEGTFLDPTALANDALAKSMDIVRIVYDFAHSGDAGAFLAHFPPEPGRLPCGDFEAGDLTIGEAETWVRAVLAAYKRVPLIYGHSLLNQWNPGPASPLRQCYSWQPTYGMSLTPVPWAKDPLAWQYSDGQTKWSSPGPRSFPGVGACDMNTLRIPTSQLRLMAGIIPPPPPPKEDDLTPEQEAQLKQASDAGYIDAQEARHHGIDVADGKPWRDQLAKVRAETARKTLGVTAGVPTPIPPTVP